MKQVVFCKGDEQQGVVSETIWEGKDEHADEHSGPIRDFAQAIQQGREPLTSLNRAMVMQRIFDATYESCRSGQCVDV